MDVNRVVIIGSPGAGKTTLARRLHSILNIKVVHLDRIFWEPGWKEKPRETRIDILQKIVQEKQWIIEGTYLGSSDPRLEAADTIIFLDTATLVCLFRMFKRHFDQGTRRDIPIGCVDKLGLMRIFKVLDFPIRGRRTLNRKLRNCNPQQFVRLHSNKTVEKFLAQLGQQTNDETKESIDFSTLIDQQVAIVSC